MDVKEKKTLGKDLKKCEKAKNHLPVKKIEKVDNALRKDFEKCEKAKAPMSTMEIVQNINNHFEAGLKNIDSHKKI